MDTGTRQGLHHLLLPLFDLPKPKPRLTMPVQNFYTSQDIILREEMHPLDAEHMNMRIDVPVATVLQMMKRIRASAGWFRDDTQTPTVRFFLATDVESAVWWAKRHLPPADWDLAVSGAPIPLVHERERLQAATRQTVTDDSSSSEIAEDDMDALQTLITSEAATITIAEHGPESDEEVVSTIPPPVEINEDELIVKVSNLNRKKMQARKRRQDAQRRVDESNAKRQKQSDLVIQDSDSASGGSDGDSDEEVPRPEASTAVDTGTQNGLPRAESPADEVIRAAVREEDKPLVCSLFKHDLASGPGKRSTSTINYKLVEKMIRNMHSIGNVEVLREWKTILQDWRSGDSQKAAYLPSSQSQLLVRTGQMVAMADTTERPTSLEERTKAMRDTLDAVRRSRAFSVLQAFTYRRLLASLYGQYLEATTVLTSDPTSLVLRRGVNVASVAKAHIFRKVYPQFEKIVYPSSDERSRSCWSTFNHELESGSRWHLVGQELGWGIFGLMSDAIISRKWIEQTLSMNNLRLWVDHVREYNPKAVLLGKSLNDGIQAFSRSPVAVGSLQLEDLDLDDEETVLGDTNLFAVRSVV